MPIYATNYSTTSTNPTNYAGGRGNEVILIGSPIGLLLVWTWNESIDVPSYDYATNYTSLTVGATNWTNDNVFIDELELQNGSILVLQDGGQLLIP